MQVLIYPDEKQGNIPINSDKFLIIGGKCRQSTNRLDSMLIYDTTNNTLQEISNRLTSPRSGFGVVIYQEMLYVVGGSDNKSILSTL
jgi:hypothetical protein